MGLNHSAKRMPTDGLALYLDAGISSTYDNTENLLSFSTKFENQTYWNNTLYPVTVTPNAVIAPDGTTTACLLGQPGIPTSLIYQFIPTSTTGFGVLTCSVYAKAGSTSVFTLNCYYIGDTESNWTFDLSNGTAATFGAAYGTPSILALSNGWYRCSIQIPANATSATQFVWRIWPNGRSSSTVGFQYFWGSQLERGSSLSTYYPTTATTKNRTWYDISGSNNNGTLRNSPTYSSNNLGKFVLDGVSQDIDCGNNTSINFGTGDFSVSIWFRRFTSATGNLRLLSKAASNDVASSAAAGFAFYGSDTALAFTVNPTGTRVAISSVSYSLNEWVNVVGLVERGVSMRFYKNGVLTGSTSAPVGSVSGTTSLFLGSNLGTNLFWTGEISNVSLYNRALSAEEILQNYNALKGRFGL